MKADVSVVMPAFNNAATIGRALASIAAQTLPPAEVIVVDDGSTDATIDAVRRMAPGMGPVRLRLFTQENSGAGAARNRAVAEAKGAWLAFLDADDEWLPAKIERSLAVSLAGSLVMSAHNLYGIGPGGESLIDSRSRWLADPAEPYRALFLRGFISSSTVLVRTEALKKAGGFDSGLRSAQDYEMWLAVLAEAGNRFEIFADPLLRYTLAADGITSRIDRKVACSLAILERHMGILKRRPGPLLAPVILRTLIIHAEAARGYLARGDVLPALKQALLCPFRLAAILARLPWAGGHRPDFLANLVPAREVSL